MNKNGTVFKSSGVEWVGDVPEHWQVCKLKRLSPVKRGASPRPIDDPKFFDDDGEFSWVRISDVTASRKYLTQTTQKLSTLGSSLSVKLEPETFFVSIAASVGKPIITKIKCCIHDGFVYFPYLQINPDFLYYLFDGGQLFQGLGKLGTQLNLNTETIGSIHIPLPPNDEIQLIVDYLNRETTQIDNLIAAKEQMLTLLEEKREALISHAVTRGLDPNVAFKRSGLDWLGDIPQHWQFCQIRRLSPVKRGASPRPIDDLKYFDDDGEFSWVRISDVTASRKYLTQTTEKLSVLGSSLSVKLYPETFFVSIAASVGKPIITKIKCCIHDGFVYFPYLRINNNFLYYLFEGGQLFKGLGKLGTQLNLNTETIGSIHIPIPPDDEIEMIVDFLDYETAKIDKLVAAIKDSITLLKERRSALITAAVTGQIALEDMTS